MTTTGKRTVIAELEEWGNKLDDIMKDKSPSELWLVSSLVYGIRKGKSKDSYWFSEEANRLFYALVDRVTQATKERKGIPIS